MNAAGSRTGGSSSITSLTDNDDLESAAGLELRALERMIGARCEQIERMARDAVARNDLDSRESELQIQVFAERRSQALDQIGTATSEPLETRAARLERLLEALECSRAYFCPRNDLVESGSGAIWGVLVK